MNTFLLRHSSRLIMSMVKHSKCSSINSVEFVIHKRLSHGIYSTITIDQSLMISGYNYIGESGIYFQHNDSPYVMCLTSDRQAVIDGNRLDNKSSIVFWYISDQLLPQMQKKLDYSKMRNCIQELNKWNLFNELNPTYKSWALRLPRIYVTMDTVPFNQYVFATKVLCSTFITDDPMEMLCSKKLWMPVSDYYFESLRGIYRRQYVDGLKPKPDMNQFKGKLQLPDELLKIAQIALNMQDQLVILGKDVLHPEVYDFYLEKSLEFMEFVRIEREKFSEACETKTYLSRKDILKTRLITIGTVWSVSPLITDPSTIQYMDPYNPFVLAGSWSCACDNDVIGYWKDAGSLEFSPVQLVRSLVQFGMSETDAAKVIANESNLLKMNLDDQFQLMPQHIRKHYHNYWMLINGFVDYCFLQGIDEVNTRYGWVPIKIY